MSPDQPHPDRFPDTIRKQSSRARRRKETRWWHGLGVFGLVGWMIVVPTLAGVALGRLLDGRLNSGISWTLSLLLLGLLIGCAGAWRTIRESLQ